MISQYWARDSGVISSAQSSSENPMMQLSGVRTSWQTELTNAAFKLAFVGVLRLQE